MQLEHVERLIEAVNKRDDAELLLLAIAAFVEWQTVTLAARGMDHVLRHIDEAVVQEAIAAAQECSTRAIEEAATNLH